MLGEVRQVCLFGCRTSKNGAGSIYLFGRRDSVALISRANHRSRKQAIRGSTIRSDKIDLSMLPGQLNSCSIRLTLGQPFFVSVHRWSHP